MIKNVNMDILSVAEDGIICHQVNCQGTFGKGLALQIANKYPQAKNDYKRHIRQCESLGINLSSLLGTRIFSVMKNKLYIAHLFGQVDYGYNKTYTDYDALELCFDRLLLYIRREDKAPKNIYIPYKIGCCYSKGDWNKVERIIHKVFDNCDEYRINVFICRYEGGK